MRSQILVVLSASLLAGGCLQPSMPPGPPQKPAPAVEMQKLARLIGSWSGTAEMLSPTAEEMKKWMPEGAEDMPSLFKGGGEFSWGLGGMFLIGESWHEMGPGERANYREFWTWDPKIKKYRTWFFSDWGESAGGTAWFTGDDDHMVFKATGTDADGSTKRGQGTMTFSSNDAYEWTWSETGPMGKMKFGGTSKRDR